MRRLLSLIALFSACAPELPQDSNLVDAPRVAALIAEPAEVRPRQESRLKLVVVGAGATTLDWSVSLCSIPSPIGDPRPVAESCVTEPPQDPWKISGFEAVGAVSAEACSTFGPEPKPGGYRPRDPDPSGGFYQPVRVEALGQVLIFPLRLSCPLPNAPVEVSKEFQRTYLSNQNPLLGSLEVKRQGDWEPLTQLTRGERVPVRLSWPSSSRESYVRVASDGATLEIRREALTVSWFATAGQLAPEVTGCPEDSLEDATSSAFAAPSVSGVVKIWAAARDSRGGVAVLESSVEVSE